MTSLGLRLRKNQGAKPIGGVFPRRRSMSANDPKRTFRVPLGLLEKGRRLVLLIDEGICGCFVAFQPMLKEFAVVPDLNLRRRLRRHLRCVAKSRQVRTLTVEDWKEVLESSNLNNVVAMPSLEKLRAELR